MGDKLKINFEVLLILIFSAVFLFLAISEPWDHKITHPFPYSYLASDAFFHQATNQYIKEQGIVKNTPPYTVGGNEEVLDVMPPMLFQLSSSISILSGIEVHDTIMFTAVFSFLLAILMIYLVWRQSNKNIAILALPVCLLMLSGSLTALIFWGYWLLLLGIMFMVASIWAILKFDMGRSYILIALFLTATALAHQPEFIYAGLFFAFFLLVKIFKEKRLEKNLIKNTIITGLITVILSFYALLVFSKSFLKSEGYRNAWDMQAAVGGYPVFNLVNLGLVGIIILIGVVLFLISKKDKTKIPASVSIFCFSLGYLIYLGVGKRAYAHRLFWVIYLSFFFGFALYYLLKIAVKKINVIYPFIISVVILLISAYHIYGNTKIGPGIMNQYDWDALKWISENTPKDAWIYYFYSDTLANNAPLYNSKRVSFNIRPKSFIEGLQSQEIKREYWFGLADGPTVYPHKTGPLSFCYFDHELKPKNGSVECSKEYRGLGNGFESIPLQDLQKNLCGIEYYHFTKASREPVLAQYNLAIRDFLLRNSWIEEVYSNPLVSILKNNKPGVDCFGNNTS